jgi:hypothetical protein
VQLYFSDQQTALYKLDVLVSVGPTLIDHHALDESAFARYVRFKRTGQSPKDSSDGKPGLDECLRLPLDCACREVTVKLIYGCTSTSLGGAGKESSLPTTVVEFYGDTTEAEDSGAARAAYAERVAEYEKHPAVKLSALGKSTQMLSIPVAGRPGVTRMIPFVVDPEASGDGEEHKTTEPGADADGRAESAPLELDQVRVEGLEPQPSSQSQLEELQARLRNSLAVRPAKPRGGKPEWDSAGEVASLLRQIQEAQERRCQESSGLRAGAGASSLQYLTTLAGDLTRLITACHRRADLPEEELRALLASVEPLSEQPLVTVAAELFRNFVVYERATRAHVLAVIKDRIWQLMDAKERSGLFAALVREFLSRPEQTFS